MFDFLTDKFQSIFKNLFGEKKLTDANISEAVNQVRLALLEADVQYSVVKTFIHRVKEKAVGAELLKQVQPGQQFIKIVHDELVSLMGQEEEDVQCVHRSDKHRAAHLMLCGLQGAGKTTFSVKLANYLKRQGSFRNPCVVACDLQRPAAIDQLQTLAQQAQVSAFLKKGASSSMEVAKEAMKEAKAHQWDILIFDTAGRLHVDTALMQELKALKELLQPEEVLFVANAQQGQDAVKSALHFQNEVGLTGTVLTMVDGSARAGAVISIREVTKSPLKFESTGERIDDIQLFNPTSMADRILGMGDAINLVRKAEQYIEEKDAKNFEEKIRTASFTYEDYLKQMRMVKKMGSLKSLLGMLPGMSALKDMPIDERELVKIEAIILSMTRKERQEKDELSISRRKRLSKGSGTSIDDVHRLVKSFKQIKQFFKNMPNKKVLEKMMGGSPWR